MQTGKRMKIHGASSNKLPNLSKNSQGHHIVLNFRPLRAILGSIIATRSQARPNDRSETCPIFTGVLHTSNLQASPRRLADHIQTSRLYILLFSLLVLLTILAGNSEASVLQDEHSQLRANSDRFRLDFRSRSLQELSSVPVSTPEQSLENYHKSEVPLILAFVGLGLYSVVGLLTLVAMIFPPKRVAPTRQSSMIQRLFSVLVIVFCASRVVYFCLPIAHLSANVAYATNQFCLTVCFSMFTLIIFFWAEQYHRKFYDTQSLLPRLRNIFIAVNCVLWIFQVVIVALAIALHQVPSYASGTVPPPSSSDPPSPPHEPTTPYTVSPQILMQHPPQPSLSSSISTSTSSLPPTRTSIWTEIISSLLKSSLPSSGTIPSSQKSADDLMFRGPIVEPISLPSPPPPPPHSDPTVYFGGPAYQASTWSVIVIDVLFALSFAVYGVGLFAQKYTNSLGATQRKELLVTSIVTIIFAACFCLRVAMYSYRPITGKYLNPFVFRILGYFVPEIVAVLLQVSVVYLMSHPSGGTKVQRGMRSSSSSRRRRRRTDKRMATRRTIGGSIIEEEEADEEEHYSNSSRAPHKFGGSGSDHHNSDASSDYSSFARDDGQKDGKRRRRGGAVSHSDRPRRSHDTPPRPSVEDDIYYYAGHQELSRSAMPVPLAAAHEKLISPPRPLMLGMVGRSPIGGLPTVGLAGVGSVGGTSAPHMASSPVALDSLSSSILSTPSVGLAGTVASSTGAVTQLGSSYHGYSSTATSPPGANQMGTASYSLAIPSSYTPTSPINTGTSPLPVVISTHPQTILVAASPSSSANLSSSIPRASLSRSLQHADSLFSRPPPSDDEEEEEEEDHEDFKATQAPCSKVGGGDSSSLWRNGGSTSWDDASTRDPEMGLLASTDEIMDEEEVYDQEGEEDPGSPLLRSENGR